MLGLLEHTVDKPPCLVRLQPAVDVDVGQDPTLVVGRLSQLVALKCQLIVEQLTLRLDRYVLTDAHAECAGQKAGNPRKDDDRRVHAGTGHTHDQREVADEPVVSAEDNRS